jgi:ABC-type nitrate/sulfonate/bicarbonate transport system ATPase subunit
MECLQLERLSYDFRGRAANRTRAISDITLSVRVGEILGIMGASGSGKSTLLRLIAHLIRPTTGRVVYPIAQPKIGFLFQDDVILPWRTVGGNLQFPLEGVIRSSAGRQKRAEDVCHAVRLSPSTYWERYPNQLSGGERRRLSIGMAIVRQVDLLLLDEPTAQLDELNKWIFQDLIQEIWRRDRQTIILVTHSLDEAIVLADRVLIMDKGSVVSGFNITLSRPRLPGIRSEPEFVEFHQTIAKYLTGLWHVDSET